MAREKSWAGFVRTAALFLFPMGRVFNRKEAKMPKKVKTFFGSETMGRLISTKQQLESIITL
jgi:hypothetical protein